jgi:hypothetical protein
MKKFKIDYIIKVLIIVFILSIILYTWLLMLHLKLNPDMLRAQYCYKNMKPLAEKSGELISPSEFLKQQESGTKYRCGTEPVFKRVY